MPEFETEQCGDVESAKDFLSRLLELRKSEAVSHRKLLYRGVTKATYRLLPSIGRPKTYADEDLTLNRTDKINLLHRFRRRAYPHTGRTITAGEAIFLARHHFLPTRLLDWTANALYALYFACCPACPKEEWESNGLVWALLRRPEVETVDLDAFEIAAIETEKCLFDSFADPSIKIVHPIFNSPRLLAQDGAFTIQSDPWTPLESFKGLSFAAKDLDVERLYWWTIPQKCKAIIIEQLSGLGITHRSVYPDLDGIAQSLWETEVLWRRSR